MRFVIPGLLATYPLAAGQEAPPPKTVQSAGGIQRALQQGISVDFSIEPVSALKGQLTALREGDTAVFRFRLTDAGTGSPLANADPAAWASARPDGKPTDREACASQVKRFLSGSIFAQADIDLNVYYVLALNGDATISVVDPLFGFGTTKLLALVGLKSNGEDWALTSDESRLFVSMPESNQVAVVETASWTVVNNVDVESTPTRLALQPDGQYLWVAHGGAAPGVTALKVKTLQIAARFPTGKGPRQIALSGDSRLAFVTNEEDGSLSIIDARTLRKIGDLRTGRRPASIAFSNLSGMAYVVDEIDGTIVVVDGLRQEIIARIRAEPGLGQIKFAPGGRFGFVINPQKDLLHILDAASNRIVQTADLEDGPDQIAFSTKLAYVRHRGSENVLMIPLDEVGVAGRRIPIVDFPGGQNPPGKTSSPSPADGIVQAPSGDAVLVANPWDKAIYFYKEGMAAPMGSFKNYSREPRAVLVVDRSLREREPGVYETTTRMGRPGLYDVAFFLNAPRIVHCFQLSVVANPELEAMRKSSRVEIEPLTPNRLVKVGERVRVAFKLTGEGAKEAPPTLADVQVLTFMAPGVWHLRQAAQPRGGGVYEIEFVPPRPGVYYAYIECPSLGVTLSNPHYVILQATQ